METQLTTSNCGSLKKTGNNCFGKTGIHSFAVAQNGGTDQDGSHVGNIVGHSGGNVETLRETSTSMPPAATTFVGESLTHADGGLANLASSSTSGSKDLPSHSSRSSSTRGHEGHLGNGDSHAKDSSNHSNMNAVSPASSAFPQPPPDVEGGAGGDLLSVTDRPTAPPRQKSGVYAVSSAPPVLTSAGVVEMSTNGDGSLTGLSNEADGPRPGTGADTEGNSGDNDATTAREDENAAPPRGFFANLMFHRRKGGAGVGGVIGGIVSGRGGAFSKMRKSKTLSVVHEVPTADGSGEADDARQHRYHHPHYHNSQPGDVGSATGDISGLVTTPERNQINYQKARASATAAAAANTHLALDSRHSEPCPNGEGGDKKAVGSKHSLPYPLIKQNTNDSTSRFFSTSSSMHSISENSVYSSMSTRSDDPHGAVWNGHAPVEDAVGAAPPKMLTSSVSSTALLSSAAGVEDASTNGAVTTGNGVTLRGKPVPLRQQHRRHSISDISKRLSLPADLKIPDRLLIKESFSQLSLSEGPLSRRARRTSLTEIGFGKMESYVKLEKLGEGTYATVFKVKPSFFLSCSNWTTTTTTTTNY